VLAAAVDCGVVPDTVRDAVLARAARLDAGARRLLDAVAIVRPRGELWPLETIAGDQLASLESCLVSGMLEENDGTVGFRHEIARMAIENAFPLDRSHSPVLWHDRFHHSGLVVPAMPMPRQRLPCAVANHRRSERQQARERRPQPGKGGRPTYQSPRRTV
jgi:hypothetical protein